jgi:hypothetical protein
VNEGTEKAIDYEALDRRDEKERERTLEKARQEIGEALDNADGLERLEAITDEEWAKAQAVDDAVADAMADVYAEIRADINAEADTGA